MSNFMGSAIIASQNQMRDSAQKAVNHYAWAAEDAAQAAKNAHNTAAHLKRLANMQANTIENQEITIQNQEKSIKSLQNTVQMLQEMLQEKEEEIERTFEAKNKFFNDMMQLKTIVEAHIEEKKICEEIQNERELGKAKEKEILRLLGAQSSSAPKRNRRPIGVLES